MPDAVISPANAAVNTARKLTNQRVGTIAENLGSQSDDMTTALTAIKNAILARPAA